MAPISFLVAKIIMMKSNFKIMVSTHTKTYIQSHKHISLNQWTHINTQTYACSFLKQKQNPSTQATGAYCVCLTVCKLSVYFPLFFYKFLFIYLIKMYHLCHNIQINRNKLYFMQYITMYLSDDMLSYIHETKHNKIPIIYQSLY